MKTLALNLAVLGIFSADLISAAKAPYSDCESVNKLFKDNKSYKKAKKCFNIDVEKNKYATEKSFVKCLSKGKVKEEDDLAEMVECWEGIVEELTGGSDQEQQDGEEQEQLSSSTCYKTLKKNKKTKKWVKCLEEDKLEISAHEKCMKKAKDDAKELIHECYLELTGSSGTETETTSDSNEVVDEQNEEGSGSATTNSCYETISKDKKAKKYAKCLDKSDTKSYEKCMKKASDKVKEVVLECYLQLFPGETDEQQESLVGLGAGFIF